MYTILSYFVMFGELVVQLAVQFVVHRGDHFVSTRPRSITGVPVMRSTVDPMHLKITIQNTFPLFSVRTYVQILFVSQCWR